ncbi:uncharacterized protein E0L32_002114 [Thyridium curvatum]|uniref:RNase H type-1 domain-containing protein n=1 Tax=Thyridium curvatum TaxID=1093900 RepID=A0A507ALQ1_9PEZI|nr:uncharacterized protein E0L32_002019 [Thyridium curvatum]XP_030989222.1 uncharacterized protein E0L32_002114 [Thyridium curvatum]TPX07416.1 hypothetical protein E0L32_002019 [Thyridium curvatum]TPX07511.1 hypothetical protein E0L32_002114 [Thyridium curvatum]
MVKYLPVNYRCDATVVECTPIIPTVLPGNTSETLEESKYLPRPNVGKFWAAPYHSQAPPGDEFPPTMLEFPFSCGRDIRFVPREGTTDTCLVYTSGFFSPSTVDKPRPAAWAFIYGPAALTGLSTQQFIPEALRTISGPVEEKGPFGQLAPPTVVRAHLRAILAALRYRSWQGDGFKTLVIATHSHTVVEGLTWHAEKMTRDGFQIGPGTLMEDADMWMATLGEIEYSISQGLGVKLWCVRNSLNRAAVTAAERRSASSVGIENYRDYVGVNAIAIQCAYR